VQRLAVRGGEIAGRGDFFRLREDVGEEILVGDEGFLDGLGEFFLRARALHDAAAGLDDVEGVDRDVVGAEMTFEPRMLRPATLKAPASL